VKYWSLSLVAVLGLGCAAVVGVPEPAGTAPLPDNRVSADVTPLLLRLLDERKLQPVTVTDNSEPTLVELVRIVTPGGFALRTRVLQPGVAAVQGLGIAKDPQLRGRLEEQARWANSPYTRSAALVALATKKDPAHVKYLREALRDFTVGIRFAAVEAMQISGLPENVQPLVDAGRNDAAPIIQVYATQAAARLGDAGALQTLRGMLINNNRLIRAMAARYLGDLGTAQDADVLLARIGPERTSPFVLAEVCIAAIKLSAKKAPGAAPARPVPPATPITPGTPAPRALMELEPLVITAPRMRLQSNYRVDFRVDDGVLQLLQKLSQDLPPDQEMTPLLTDLDNLITPAGLELKLRYSDLSYLVVEGLAGTQDFNLIQQVERIARDSTTPRVKAAGLVSMAYTPPERRDLSLFEQSIRDTNITVRFAAVEALAIMQASRFSGILADAAENDRSRLIRVYAAHAMQRSGDVQGRNKLLNFINDPDWVIRSLAIYFLGRVGQADDYFRIQTRLISENKDAVVAESALAMLELAQK